MRVEGLDLFKLTSRRWSDGSGGSGGNRKKKESITSGHLVAKLGNKINSKEYAHKESRRT
jgi:hypothetical protein